MLEQYLNELREKYKSYKIIFNQKSNNENIKLSILICSLLERKNNLISLLDRFLPELNKYSQVEIVVHTDNRQITTGSKRNILLSHSSGEFSAFFDDDDFQSNTYCKQILEALKDQPFDAASLEGRITINGSRPRRFIHDISCGKKWFQTGNGDATTYFRGPNHLNAIRTSICREIGYKDITKGQDQDFALRVFDKIKKCAKVQGILYHYSYIDK